MNTIVSFVIGAVVGAIAALLLAPQSGEELRARMRQEAEAERQRLQSQYEKGMQDLHGRMDKIQHDIQSHSADGEELVEEAAELA
jgi:gas vesicle protein